MRPIGAFVEPSPAFPPGVGGLGGTGVPLAVAPAPDPPSRSILISIVGVLLALAVVASIGWRFSGGSLFTIATPSMCPDLCVGTLVLDQPVHGPVHVGEVVTFRPPGTTTVYTHRVVRVLPGGSFKTAGDALGKVDPWTVPPSNVVGHVVGNVRGLGWLWRSLPWMAAALACMVIARRSIPARFRRQCDLLLTTLLVVAPILVMRPLVRATVISWHLRQGGAVVMTVVNDGLLPTQFRVTGAPVVSHVAPGQIVTITGMPHAGGAVSLRQLASFSLWQWAMVALVVLLPMLGLGARTVWGRLRPVRLTLMPATMVGPAPVGPSFARPAPPVWYGSAMAEPPQQRPPVHPLR